MLENLHGRTRAHPAAQPDSREKIWESAGGGDADANLLDGLNMKPVAREARTPPRSRFPYLSAASANKIQMSVCLP